MCFIFIIDKDNSDKSGKADNRTVKFIVFINTFLLFQASILYILAIPFQPEAPCISQS